VSNYLIGDRQEAPIWALEAFYARLLAQTAYPFVCACRLVARPTGLAALEAKGINILAPAEQRSEQVDFGSGRRLIRDWAFDARRAGSCTLRGNFRRKCIHTHHLTLI
jgi:hypothetical protein